MADIDFGQLSEALNDKADTDLRNVDTTAKADAVIDYQEPTSANGYTWYRKYKSGWVEQGGYASVNENSTTTINLPVTMADTNYTALAQNNSLSTAQDTENGVGIQRTSTTQVKLFTHYINPNTISASWQVSGMAAN